MRSGSEAWVTPLRPLPSPTDGMPDDPAPACAGEGPYLRDDSVLPGAGADGSNDTVVDKCGRVLACRHTLDRLSTPPAHWLPCCSERQRWLNGIMIGGKQRARLEHGRAISEACSTINAGTSAIRRLSNDPPGCTPGVRLSHRRLHPEDEIGRATIPSSGPELRREYWCCMSAPPAHRARCPEEGRDGRSRRSSQSRRLDPAAREARRRSSFAGLYEVNLTRLNVEHARESARERERKSCDLAVNDRYALRWQQLSTLPAHRRVSLRQTGVPMPCSAVF